MIVATLHAIERYVERVKPNLGERQAREELEALSALSPDVPRPDWYVGSGDDAAFREIGPGAYAVLRSERVMTVVTEPRDEAARARKNRAKALRRQAKRTRSGRSLRGHEHGRPDAPDWSEAA